MSPEKLIFCYFKNISPNVFRMILIYFNSIQQKWINFLIKCGTKLHNIPNINHFHSENCMLIIYIYLFPFRALFHNILVCNMKKKPVGVTKNIYHPIFYLHFFISQTRPSIRHTTLFFSSILNLLYYILHYSDCMSVWNLSYCLKGLDTVKILTRVDLFDFMLLSKRD